MNLLGSALYDPAGAVSKVTTSLLAMTALDTTNLRVAVTVPAHGRLRFRLRGVHHGSTTSGQHLFGVLNGATVVARAPVSPMLLGTAVATTRVMLEADFSVSGLTPGAANFDAAYGVEIVSSAGGAIKYGGPNNTTTNDAFGGFLFEVWDPSPAVAYAAEVRTNLTTELGRIDAAVSTRLATSGYTAPPTAAANADAVWDEANADHVGAGSTGLALSSASAPSAATVADAVWDEALAGHAGAGSTGEALSSAGGELDATGVRAAVGLASANLDTQLDALPTAAETATATRSELTIELARIDAATSTRLATAGYTAPPSAAANASQVRSELTTELANLDAAVSTRLATAGYTAPPSAAANASQVRTELAVELAQITLVKKLLKNRTETNPATGIMTVYDDDGTTPLLTANIYADVAGATPYDGTAGVNRRNALS